MHVGRSLATLALILAGATALEGPGRDLRPQQELDLLRVLIERPWLGRGPHSQWDPPPRVQTDFGPKDVEIGPELSEDDEKYAYDLIRTGSSKRSAVATALNAGRRRRQPTPALGKAVIPFAGVGVLNDMGTFFDSLRDNLETLASLSPEERAMVFQGPPTVVQAPQAGSSGGGGSGFRKLHALRPLRPAGNIRSLEVDYPGANHHDPGLLWTGLGR